MPGSGTGQHATHAQGRTDPYTDSNAPYSSGQSMPTFGLNDDDNPKQPAMATGKMPKTRKIRDKDTKQCGT